MSGHDKSPPSASAAALLHCPNLTEFVLHWSERSEEIVRKIPERNIPENRGLLRNHEQTTCEYPRAVRAGDDFSDQRRRKF